MASPDRTLVQRFDLNNRFARDPDRGFGWKTLFVSEYRGSGRKAFSGRSRQQ
jgi:hypothetical protein